MKHIKLFESWGVEEPSVKKNIQLLPDSEVMPKVAEIAKKMNIYLIPQIMEFKFFTQKVYSLKGNFNIEGVDYSAIIAHTGLPSSVQLFCYSKSDSPTTTSFKLIENFYEVLKKEFPSIKFKDFYADRTNSEGNYNFNGNTVEIGGAKIWDFTKEI
jgi:hypothetical protein